MPGHHGTRANVARDAEAGLGHFLESIAAGAGLDGATAGADGAAADLSATPAEPALSAPGEQQCTTAMRPYMPTSVMH